MFNLRSWEMRLDMLKALMGEKIQYNGDITAYIIVVEGPYTKLVSCLKDYKGELSDPRVTRVVKWKLPKRIKL